MAAVCIEARRIRVNGVCLTQQGVLSWMLMWGFDKKHKRSRFCCGAFCWGGDALHRFIPTSKLRISWEGEMGLIRIRRIFYHLGKFRKQILQNAAPSSFLSDGWAVFVSLLADLTVDCRAAPALTSFNRILHTELYLKVGFNLESDSQAARRRTGEQGSRWNSRSCGRNRKSSFS